MTEKSAGQVDGIRFALAHQPKFGQTTEPPDEDVCPRCCANACSGSRHGAGSATLRLGPHPDGSAVGASLFGERIQWERHVGPEQLEPPDSFHDWLWH